MSDWTIVKLKRLLDKEGYHYFSETEMKDIVKEVQKGIKLPLKPLRRITRYNSEYCCPNCEQERWITNGNGNKPKRCVHCGQRLDWKDFNIQENFERNECDVSTDRNN